MLRVTGEAGRYFGTRHREAVQSAQNLLSRISDRISDAERNRVLEVVQCVPGPSTHGSQPSLVLCRRFRVKRKINETDIVKNRLDAKKLAINFNQGASVGVVKNRVETKKPAINSNQGARIEQRKMAGLHYLLRIPLLQAEEDPEADDVVKPAPLLLFLHGSGERGSDDGSELSMVRKHGPWECDGAVDFFILAPQCPRKHVWPAFVNEVLLLLKDVCERHVVDKSRVYITGLSMGAFGAWMLRFATGMAHSPERRMAFQKCKDMPAWLFHGKKDTIVDPKASEEVFHALGGTSNEHVRRTLYTNAGHRSWRKAYNTLELYAWLDDQQ